MQNRQPATHPVPLQNYEGEVSALRERARALTEPLGDTAFNFSPRPGAWSIGQCLQHLADTHVMYAGAIERSIERAGQRGWTASGEPAKRFGWLERWFIANLEPPARRRFKAPGKVRPAPHLDPDTVRSAYRATLDKTLALRQDSEGLDLHRAKVASPLAGWLRFRLGAAFSILTAHDRRHLEQAEKVAADVAFPG